LALLSVIGDLGTYPNLKAYSRSYPPDVSIDPRR
jgi:hypothetical protein